MRVTLSMIAEHEPGDTIAGVELELVPKRHPYPPIAVTAVTVAVDAGRLASRGLLDHWDQSSHSSAALGFYLQCLLLSVCCRRQAVKYDAKS